MTALRPAMLIAAAGLLAACASVPTAPSVLVLAGAGKTWEQFRADESSCRQSASEEIRRTKSGGVPAQRRYDMVYVQCMYAKGHYISASGAPAPAPSSSEAVPPGTPTAAPSSWPPTQAQVNCERSGGVWRAALNFCEFPAPDTPGRR